MPFYHQSAYLYRINETEKIKPRMLKHFCQNIKTSKWRNVNEDNIHKWCDHVAIIFLEN